MGTSYSHTEEKLDSTILESLHNAAHAFNIDPQTITFEKNNNQKTLGLAGIWTITINEKELLKNRDLIDFVTYREMANIVEWHTLKAFFNNFVDINTLICIGYYTKIISNYISGAPLYIKFMTYGGLMCIAGNIISQNIKYITHQEIMANRMACSKLIPQGKIVTINAYLAYLMLKKIMGEKRIASSHPTVKKEYDDIYLLLKKYELIVSYNTNFTHRISAFEKILSSISVTGNPNVITKV